MLLWVISYTVHLTFGDETPLHADITVCYRWTPPIQSTTRLSVRHRFMYMILCVVSETALCVNTVLFVVLSYTVQLEVVGETQLHVHLTVCYW